MLSCASSSEDGWMGRSHSNVHCWGGSRLPSYFAGMSSIAGSLALECLGCRVRPTRCSHYGGGWFPRGGAEGPAGAGAGA